MEKSVEEEVEILKEIKAKLENESENEKILRVLKGLSATKYEREALKQSQIIIALKKLKEKNTNKDINDAIITVVKGWKSVGPVKTTANPAKAQKITQSNISQLKEGSLDLGIIEKISKEISKEENDRNRFHTKKILFESISKNKKAYEIFKNKTSVSKITQEEFLKKVKGIISEIESKMFNEFLLKKNLSKYRSQTKTLIINFSKNEDFVHRIIDGSVIPHKVAMMTTEEMMSEADKKKLEKAKEEFFDSRRSDWNMEHGNYNVSGLYKCGKCKSTKTTYNQIQIRRADEPMTTFVTCLNCGNGWRC